MAEISVIVPVYNVSRFLVQCLESIVGQTFEDVEIICVNDGSTDGSLEILRKYAQSDKRIKIINRDIASGSAAKPRNIGMALATGKYIMFLDADDYFDKYMLEKLYNAAEEV